VKKGFMDMMTIINVFKQGAMNLSVPKFIMGQSRTKIQRMHTTLNLKLHATTTLGELRNAKSAAKNVRN
jgi:hypothetical protein